MSTRTARAAGLRQRAAPAAAVLAVLAPLAALATACGVPTEDETRTLGTPPFGLLTTSTTVTPTTVLIDEGFRLVLYWVTANDEMTPGAPIGLPGTPTFQEVVDLLVKGPAISGSTSGATRPTTGPAELRTYVTEAMNPEPDGAQRLAVGPLVRAVDDRGVLDLLVDERFREASQETPTRFRLAIAQVVCTVTQFENVSEVRFFDDRGQLTLVNLEQTPIEVATRDNIGDCDPD